MPHSYFYLNWDYIIKVNANFLALGSATIDYITFKGSTVEPGYRQGPNPYGPANRTGSNISAARYTNDCKLTERENNDK
jgi:hypothetical protein